MNQVYKSNLLEINHYEKDGLFCQIIKFNVKKMNEHLEYSEYQIAVNSKNYNKEIKQIVHYFLHDVETVCPPAILSTYEVNRYNTDIHSVIASWDNEKDREHAANLYKAYIDNIKELKEYVLSNDENLEKIKQYYYLKSITTDKEVQKKVKI